MERRNRVRDKNSNELNLYPCNLTKRKEITFQKHCFHKAHKSAWTTLGFLHDDKHNNNGVTTEDTLVRP